MSQAGQFTNGALPVGAVGTGFLATGTSNITAVTGDGTVYSMGTSDAFTSIFDTTGSFYLGSGAGAPALFTAPATGTYYFQFFVNFSANPATTSLFGNLTIVTTPRNYVFLPQANGWNIDGTAISTGGVTIFTNLNVGNTVEFRVQITSHAGAPGKTIGIEASQTFIGGYRVS